MTRSRRALSVTVAIVAIAMSACGGSGDKHSADPAVSAARSASAVSTASAGDPLDDFKIILEALNRKDAVGVYAGLSAEARKNLTVEQARTLVRKLFDADANFHVTVDKENSREINGDAAELGLTLLVNYVGQQFPLTEVAYLVVEDGVWKLSDHFLQTALSASGAGPPPAKPRTYRADGCAEGDVLAGVYLPSRLKVLDPCVSVIGTVVSVELPEAGEGDGDLSFDLDLGGDDQHLLNDANLRNTHGGLHIEIVPQDRDRLPTTPQVGQRVRVQGSWVIDEIHGHNEIHPAWAVAVLP